MLFYIILGLLDGSNLLCILVRDLELEFLFQRHDQLDQIQRVGVEILNKRSAGNDFALIDAKLIHNNLFETLRNGCHYFTSLSAIGVGCCCARLNIVPRTPLIKRLDVLLPKSLASSTASLMAAFAGTVLLNRMS